MKGSELLIKAEQALSAKQFDQGLSLLRQYNYRSNTHNAESWHKQAVLEEQIGDLANAGESHYKCIAIAPQNALGYLYAGYWLEQQGQTNAAISLYSLADDIDSSILRLGQKKNVSGPTQLRSKAADNLLRATLSENQRNVCSQTKNTERINNAIWVKTNDQPIPFAVNDFHPEIFFIPNITTKPFYSQHEFGWIDSFKARYSQIKKELINAMQQQLAKDNLRPYLGEKFSTHASLDHLANSTDWMAIDLFKNGELNSKISNLFPNTLDALKSVPTYNLDENPVEVFFSFLKPNQTIPSHFGQSNHALTAHLALDIPAESYFKVADQKQAWKEGELLIFDDSFLHSAHNNSNKIRLVLIFSIWHPDLTVFEKEAIKLSFRTRQKWVSDRPTQLQKLRPPK